MPIQQKSRIKLILTTKNLSMKKLKKIGLVVLLSLATISCHKDDPVSPAVVTCGCENGTTIDSKNNVAGVLKKNSGIFRLDSVLSNYYIQIGTPPGLTFYYLNCNDNFLNGITVPENIPINVTFSGTVKEFCVPTGIIFIYPTNNINLTQITQL